MLKFVFKKVNYFALVILGTWMFAFPAFAENPIVFSVNQPTHQADAKDYALDQGQVFINNGRVYTSSRFVAQTLGADVKWFDRGEYQSIALTKGEDSLVFIVNREDFLVKHGNYYSKLEQMDTSPLLLEGRAYLPAKYVLENLGYKVTFDEVTGSLQADWSGVYTKEGFTVPLKTALSLITFYPADIEMELIMDSNKDTIGQQLKDAGDILASKFSDELSGEIIRYVSQRESLQDYLPLKSFKGGLITVGAPQGSPYITVRVWK